MHARNWIQKLRLLYYAVMNVDAGLMQIVVHLKL